MRHLFRLATAIAIFCASQPSIASTAAQVPLITFSGSPEVVFNPKTDACDGHDVPDIAPRAYRDEAGNVHLFAMHFENRALVGKDLNAMKLACKVVFRGTGNENPAAYDDKSWIAATWTNDGKQIFGLIHHEYQAHSHPKRCVYSEYLPCWYNSILAVRSSDGGQSFVKAAKSPVATFPFEQQVGQGRHRGFFNPSNIVSDGAFHYMMASTTGWSGQSAGVCLFRTDDISDPGKWRAWDGTDFSVRFSDPYKGASGAPRNCQTIAPFPAPVGSISKHTPSGQWVAVFQASGNGGVFPKSGIYAASSVDLKVWSKPRLILDTKTLYDDPCSASFLSSYPALLDKNAKSRNFEDIGDNADLYLSRMRVESCRHTSDRLLVRIPVKINFQ